MTTTAQPTGNDAVQVAPKVRAPATVLAHWNTATYTAPEIPTAVSTAAD